MAQMEFRHRSNTFCLPAHADCNIASWYECKRPRIFQLPPSLRIHKKQLVTLITHYFLKEWVFTRSSSHLFCYKAHTDKYLKLVGPFFESIQLLNPAENSSAKTREGCKERQEENKSTSFQCQGTERFLSCSQHSDTFPKWLCLVKMSGYKGWHQNVLSRCCHKSCWHI